ncbi:MAG TPA: hypothetical protein VEB68_01515 [Croceibacterium sp.]|nr:hypothetical protein [Croceibacterium sp.]
MLARIAALALTGLAGALLAAAPAAARAVDEPLARFEDPICPGVAGLKVELAEMIVYRMREVAASLGRRLAAEEGCEANLVLAVVADGQAFARRMEERRGWSLADLTVRERAELLDDSGPARAFLRVRPVSRDGILIGRRENLVDIPQTTMWMAHSKIYTATRNDIVSSLVLLDRDAVAGLTLTQLADYAVFRGLTRTLPETEAARGRSIVSLFDGGGERPAGLTEFDLAFLGELYEGQPNIPGPLRQLALEQATGVDVFEQ